MAKTTNMYEYLQPITFSKLQTSTVNFSLMKMEKYLFYVFQV